MLKENSRKISYNFLIAIIPAVYLLLGFYFRQVFGDLSLRSVDPEYIHFISGLSVSAGHLGDANIDQPASILHLLLALIFRLVYFFREHNLPYFEDVIRHSDLYLSVANLVITTLVAAVMLWAGKAIEQISKNVLYAIMIQISPLLLNIWYDLFGRIYVELLFVIPVLMLQVLIFKEIYQQGAKDRVKAFQYGFTVALGMSMKMTFFPFAFLPLFLIKTVRDKFRYVFYTVVSFCLLALPVVFRFKKFVRWMTDLFMHSGVYQEGPKSVVDPALFIKNIQLLISTHSNYFIVLLLLLLLAFFAGKGTNRALKTLNWGLIVVLMMFVFFVGKHFELRYFIPALLVFPFLLILLKENITSFYGNKILNLILSVVLIVIIGYKIDRQIPYIRIVSESVGSQMAARIKTREVANTLKKDSYKIIVSQDYGCPFQEYAIMYSFSMGGKSWPNYKEKLNALYPCVYQYFTWDNSLRYWGEAFDLNHVVASGKPVYLYLEKNTEALYQKTVRKLIGQNDGFSVRKEMIFENPRNGEAIMELFFSKTMESGPVQAK